MAYQEAGKVAEGLAIVEEGLGLCETTVARFHEAELWRLKGELLHRRGDADPAEAAFGRALEVARRRRARSYELRAAIALARLLRERRRGDEARSPLGKAYGCFREGFATRDLRVAKALLAELT